MELISSIVNLLASIPLFSKKDSKKSDFKRKYEELRFNVAQALTMYACYYSNPIDLAEMPDHALPENYREASKKLRELASTAKALSCTMPCMRWRPPIKKTELELVLAHLMGLSNSMTTPYNMPADSSHWDDVHQWEYDIKNTLHL